MRMMEECNCAACGIEFGLPSAYEAALRKSGKNFYCPNGHSLSFGESEADKMRRERDRAKQEAARLVEEAHDAHVAMMAAERRLSSAKGQVTRLKNRARAGLCPCCNRSFINLQRHMGTKHPGFVAEPQDSEHVH